MEKSISKRLDITLKIIDDENLQSAIECFTDSFQREPIAQVLNINHDEFYPFAKIVCQKAIKDKMGYIAIDNPNKKVIALSIMEDCIQETTNEYDNISSKFLPIFALLGNMVDTYLKDKNITESGQVANFFILATYLDYQGTGVTKPLIDKSINLLNKKGYKIAIAETTSPTSQYIGRKIGFKDLEEVFYKDFIFEENNVFKDIPKEIPSCILQEITIQNTNRLSDVNLEYETCHYVLR